MDERPEYEVPVYRPHDPVAELIQMLKTLAWRISFPIYLIMLISSVVILLGTLPMVLNWFGQPGNLGGISVAITPVPVGFGLGGLGIQVWFIFVVLAVFGSFVLMKYQLLSAFVGKKFTERFSSPDKAVSGLEVTAKLFMATLFFYLIFVMVLSLFTIEPVIPDFASNPIESNIYGYVNAAVNEEIISRMLLIGLPMLLIETAFMKKRPLKRYLLGGGLPINALSVMLILFSATMFALAHTLGSWDVYKIPTTFVSGLALGYLFVKFGIWASIIFHFSTNFFLIGIDLWPNNPMLPSIIAFAWLFMAAAGSYFFAHYFLKVLRLPKKLRKKQAEYVLEKIETLHSGNVFICKNCGGFQARYDSEEHTLTCLTCGYKDRP